MESGKFPISRRSRRGFPHFGALAALAFLPLLPLVHPATAAEAPVVDSFSADPPQVAPGEIATFTVEAHDPDCPDSCTSGCGLYIRADLTSWSATGGAFEAENDGTSGSPYTASADWRAPAEEGTYTISVYLADSGSSFCGGRKSTTVDLDILVSATASQPPVIESLTAEPVQLFPEETSELTCVATDPDGDPVTYSWEATSGSIAPGAEGSATFTAGDPAVVTVTCTATDPGGAFASEFVLLSVTGATLEGSLDAGLRTPQRVAVDSMGDVYVVDRQAGGLVVLNLFSGEPVYRLALGGLRSVAVDWGDDLLLGGDAGAEVRNRRGELLLALVPGGSYGVAVDVATDPVNRRYGVLYGNSGRVVVYGETGSVVAEFGSTGDGADQLRIPQGLAATPDGDWVVADGGHGQVKVFDAAGTLLSTFGDLGGGAGEFVRLDDVEVDAAGVIYASDSFQSWIQAFNPDGSLRETLGGPGEEVGALRTPAGLVVIDPFQRLLAASLNSSTVQLFRTSNAPLPPPPAPAGALSVAELTFDLQAVGTESAPQVVTLGNTGDAPLGVREVQISGPFRLADECGLFVDPGQSCNASVRFAPDGAGAAAGSLTFQTSDPAGPFTVSLTGDGYVPAGVLLDPDLLRFSDQEVGTTSAAQTSILTNTGTVPLEILGITISGEFAGTHDCPTSLPGGDSCSVSVWSAPLTVEDFLFGEVRVDSSAAASPHVVNLRGRGIPAPARITITDVEIEEGDSGQTQADFAVRLAEPAQRKISVDYETSADTASEIADFLPVSGRVLFSEGDAEMPISVEIVGDVILEPDVESFQILLAEPPRGILEDNVGEATILDDEICPGPNLLVNPGAEEWQSVPGILPGWSAASAWTRRTSDPDPLDGRAYFSAATGLTTELTQDVDLSPYLQAIAGGEQLFAFEGWVRTSAQSLGDSARFVVEYRDAPDGAVLDAWDSGELVSDDQWLQALDVRAVPQGAGWARVRLIAAWPGDADPVPFGFFDALSLRSVRRAAVSAEQLAAYEGDVGAVEGSFDLRLSCPYYQEVAVDYATVDGVALAGLDYAATVGTALLPAGQESEAVPVTIYGDELAEGHEAFGLDLQLAGPAEAVLVDSSVLGWILDDDVCARGVGYWKNHEQEWPVDHLLIGGVEYGVEEIRALFEAAPRRCGGRCVTGAVLPPGQDASRRLARQLAATRFNLAAGSDPVILPSADAADALLEIWPPGVDAGDARAEIDALTEELAQYNSACDEPATRFGGAGGGKG